MTLHIAVDLDDVMLDFYEGLRHAVQTEYAVELPRYTMNQWDLHPILDPIIGYSWWTWLRKRDWLWKNFPAVPGSIGAIDQLRRDGHYMELVTAKPEWAEHAVWQWLGKWRPAFQRVTIVPSGDGAAPKYSVTDADLLIDDKVSNVAGFTRVGRLGWLFERPHNLNESVPSNVLRVTGWTEVVEHIRKMEQVEGELS